MIRYGIASVGVSIISILLASLVTHFRGNESLGWFIIGVGSAVVLILQFVDPKQKKPRQ